jgi:hypothetical protein
MRQINFGLIFVFGLITVFFTLENTAPTTVHVLPGMHYTLPLAGLLLTGRRDRCRIRLVFRHMDGDVEQR